MTTGVGCKHCKATDPNDLETPPLPEGLGRTVAL